jgi:hypothetical protein
LNEAVLTENPSSFFEALERQLLSSDTRSCPDQLASLLADNFVEFGSSGSIYTKADELRALPNENPFSWDVTDFKIRILVDNVVLVTYRVTQYYEVSRQPRATLRSSIWQCFDGAWKIVFHQGTVTIW